MQKELKKEGEQKERIEKIMKERIGKIMKEWFPEGKLERKKEFLEQRERKEKVGEEEEILKKLSEIKIPKEKETEVLRELDTLQKRNAVKEKVRHLLILAQKKGIAFAISVAKASNDPLLIDLFHDILVKEELFKIFPI